MFIISRNKMLNVIEYIYIKVVMQGKLIAVAYTLRTY